MTFAFHICVDMQRMFAEDTEWHAPWMARVAPAVTALAEAHPSRTVFTRFIPPARPEESMGAWEDYYRHWRSMTREALHPELLDLLPALQRLVPPARIFDKPVYSPWHGGRLHEGLRRQGVRTLVVTGGETEVCVLATVLGALDLGYRIVLPIDALCSSADETHDAMIRIYESRFGLQVITTTTDVLLAGWPD
ncbi:Nicotinamidase-related amidase [Devosia enhydra]|uniref:Nicotinamidase-related amidase n=1 Tax=Devosia enhydra TaxID=665118 RepID=A0A1K2HSR3_9HYPH|nr:isochorismatase family cysteine hydrolase [Devosia enhydra]SFZ80777.1 Nicotinamidase-related amidase [Devosia enhydra]